MGANTDRDQFMRQWVHEFMGQFLNIDSSLMQSWFTYHFDSYVPMSFKRMDPALKTSFQLKNHPIKALRGKKMHTNDEDKNVTFSEHTIDVTFCLCIMFKCTTLHKFLHTYSKGDQGPGAWGWRSPSLMCTFPSRRECPAQNQHAPGLTPRLHGNTH